MMVRSLVASLLAAVLVGVPGSGTGAADIASEGLVEQIVETRPREGVYQRSLLSRRPVGEETWLVVAFPGWPGILRLRADDDGFAYDLRGNFLIRARRHLVSDQIAVAILDCPSDHLEACGDGYRSSEAHVEDVRQQIAALRKRLPPGIRVALVGTSYGTVSSEVLALRLGEEIDAAVHTASITAATETRSRPLFGLDVSKARSRQLFVHHVDDPCDMTPFAGLKRYEGVVPILRVVGTGTPRGPACEAFTAHGFVGRERLVMEAVAGWLLSGKVGSPIE
jgi:pimeloyl-ACP methyl ester carboxylesterase